jgi:hypothetical protein
MPESAEFLWRVWDDNHKMLSESRAAADKLSDAIQKCRVDNLAVLEALD